MQVRASKHCQDYHITPDHIRNLRTQFVDGEWKRAKRDVDSVLALVRHKLTVEIDSSARMIIRLAPLRMRPS